MKGVIEVGPLETREGICQTEEIALAKKGTKVWKNLALFKNRVWFIMVGKQETWEVWLKVRQNFKWIQGATIPIPYALERNWRLLMGAILADQRIIQRWRFCRLGKQKTKQEITEDWDPCSAAGMKREQFGKAEEELVKYFKQLWEKQKRYLMLVA